MHVVAAVVMLFLCCACWHIANFGWFSEVTVVFKNVCKHVPMMAPGQSGPPELKQILFNVSGVVKPGEVAALMVCGELN